MKKEKNLSQNFEVLKIIAKPFESFVALKIFSFLF